MKKIITTLASCIILTQGSAFAATAVSGPYIRGFGGAAVAPDNVNANNFSQTKYLTGWDAGGQIGYKSGPIRYEFEAGYIHNKLEKFNFNSVRQTSISGSSKAITGFLNLYYDFEDFNASLAPYVGFGIGYSHVHIALDSSSPSNSSFNRKDLLFSYKGQLGINYNFSENYSVDIGYEYLRTSHSNKFADSYQAHLFNMGITYRFDN